MNGDGEWTDSIGREGEEEEEERNGWRKEYFYCMVRGRDPFIIFVGAWTSNLGDEIANFLEK